SRSRASELSYHRRMARPPWLDRFRDPSVIRRRGVVEHVACRDVASGERRLVIATTERGLRELFDAIARLHGELQHPHIPALVERGAAGDTEFVALRSAAIADVDTLLPIAMHAGGLSPSASLAF